VFDTWLRAFKDRLVSPWLRHVSPAVRPNMVSILACAVGVTASAAAWQRRYGLALVLWLANRALDGIDGALARAQEAQTDFGGYLDVVLDFVVYALLPIGLVAGAPTSDAWHAAVVLLATYYINAASWLYLSAILERRSAGAAARGERTTVTMPSGLIGGTETIVLYALFLIVPSHLAALFVVTAILVALTVVQRLVWAARTL
jgi:phosphatidylglycerophosphate synthase